MVRTYCIRAAWILVIIATIGIGSRFDGTFTDTPGLPQDRSLLMDRPWVNHIPTSPKDSWRMLVFLSKEGEEEFWGAYRMAESAYKFHIEIFKHRITDKEIRFGFPHDDSHGHSGYTVEKMTPRDGKLDLKLTIKRDPRGRGAGVYFSSTEWKQDDRTTWPAWAQEEIRQE